jgi:hypothetical protein
MEDDPNRGGGNMKIDIDELTEAELIDLNHRIVERLRFLNQMRAHGRMLEFKIGDRVIFQPGSHPPVVGMLTRYNRKTVTVITDDGQHCKKALLGSPISFIHNGKVVRERMTG